MQLPYKDHKDQLTTVTTSEIQNIEIPVVIWRRFRVESRRFGNGLDFLEIEIKPVHTSKTMFHFNFCFNVGNYFSWGHRSSSHFSSFQKISWKNKDCDRKRNKIILFRFHILIQSLKVPQILLHILHHLIHLYYYPFTFRKMVQGWNLFCDFCLLSLLLSIVITAIF